MKLSTCPAPHSSPGGLRLCSKCFRPLVHGNRLHPQQVAFCAASLQLHLPLFSAKGRTPALKGFVCTALPHRQSTPSSPHSRPAEPLAVACIRSQLQLSTCLAPHSSPEGLRLHNTPHRQTPEHTQQSAFAPGCNTCIGLQSQSDEAQHLPRTALQPWRASFVQQCFRPLVQGNRLHPQQVAFCAVSLDRHPTQYRSALPGAALRPSGSICAAMLSLSNATARIRCRLLSCSKSAAAFSCFCRSFLPGCRTPALKGFVCTTCRTTRRQSTHNSQHSRPAVQFASACIRSQMKLSTCLAPHSSPGGLRLCSSAFARSGTATGCIRSRLPSMQ